MVWGIVGQRREYSLKLTFYEKCTHSCPRFNELNFGTSVLKYRYKYYYIFIINN